MAKIKEVGVFFCLLAVFTLIFSFNAFADTISIVADQWCPYNCVPDSPESGYGIEIAAYAFKKAGHKLEYKNVPWARAIQDARKGKYTAIIGAFIEDAPDFVFPDEEIGVSKNVFFVKKGASWKYKGIQSLAGVKVGVIKDYSYGEELDNYFKKNNDTIQFVAGEDALVLNIKKLLKGRIDTLIEDPNVFFLTAKKMGVTAQIVKAGDSGKGENIYIAFSPKNPKSKEYAKILSQGLVELKTSGKLKEILAKYGLEYWK